MADVSAAVGDFLEVAINHLLFLRGVYPAGKILRAFGFILHHRETYQRH